MDYLITFEDGSEGYLSHHGVRGMHWGVLSAETMRKYGYATKKHLAKAEKLRQEAQDYVKKAKTAERRRAKIARIKGPKGYLTDKAEAAFDKVNDISGDLNAKAYKRGDAVYKQIAAKTIGNKPWDYTYAARQKMNESEVFLTEAKLIQERKAKRMEKKAKTAEKKARSEEYKAVMSAAKNANVTLSRSDKVALKTGQVKVETALKMVDNRAYTGKSDTGNKAYDKAYAKEAKRIDKKYSKMKSEKQITKVAKDHIEDLSRNVSKARTKKQKTEASAKQQAMDDFRRAKSNETRMTIENKASVKNRAARNLDKAADWLRSDSATKRKLERYMKGYAAD